MKADKIETFMALAGQAISTDFIVGDEKKRKLGAQLILSEVLEYVVDGLGVTPVVNGVEIDSPDGLEYKISGSAPSKLEMLDGLADVAYTMYWNSTAFGIPLEEGFELVCGNNLEKFVALEEGAELSVEGELAKSDWHCAQDISWPSDVETVQVVRVSGQLFAVGKDKSGKVRKPSSFKTVDLSSLLDR